MEQELSSLWAKVLGEIETEVSKAIFLTLFKNTALLSFEKNVATVAAPSPMIIDLLNKRYHLLLKKTLSKHTGQDSSLIFTPKTRQLTDKTNGPLFVEEKKERVLGHLPRVRPDFTFQTLAVSSSNQLAYVSAQTVANNLGFSYNPLFVYGPVGVGKTHLMQAVANEVYQKHPSSKIIYITSEEFTNEVVEAIKSNDTGKMKKRFRSVSLLLIDDVQFIAGKDRVQEELFHTFNILIDAGSQIVLSSDRPPSEIKKLEARLASRFSGGLTVDIEPPDFELRTAILLIKARKHGVDLPIEVAKTIAENISDTRGLEGALLQVVTQAKTNGENITVELARRTLNAKQQEENSHFHPDDIIKNACFFYDIKPTQIKGPRREASLVKARQVVMFILKKELGLSFSEIGNMLGGRDHTTVIHGVNKIEKLLSTAPQLTSEIIGITKRVRG